MSRGQGSGCLPSAGLKGLVCFPGAPPASPHNDGVCACEERGPGWGQGVLESGQRPGQLTPALQVHHSIQVIRDGVPGIGDELGEAGIHFLLHLIVSARKMAVVNHWASLKASCSPE